MTRSVGKRHAVSGRARQARRGQSMGRSVRAPAAEPHGSVRSGPAPVASVRDQRRCADTTCGTGASQDAGLPGARTQDGARTRYGVRASAVRPGWLDRTGCRAREATVLLVTDAVAMVAFGLFVEVDLAMHLVVCAITMALCAYTGLYRLRLTVSILDDLPRLLVCLVGGLAVGVPLQAALLRTEPLVGAGLVVTRALAYALLRSSRARLAGSGTVILGTGQVGRRLGQAMLDHPAHGLRLLGYLDDGRRRQTPLPAPLLGSPRELGRVIEELGVGHVVVTFGTVPVAALVDVVRMCDRLRCEILLVPRLFELHTTNRDTEYVQGLPLVRMRRAPFRGLSWRVKRAFDVVASAVLVVVLAPVLAGCALAVRLEGGPGVLFRQERVGIDGRRFQMLKFRSLKPSSAAESQLRWTVAHDPRIGPVGRLLRTTSLDELPQLVNVLRGDMSLVGPRPERPHFVDRLSRHHPRYRARLRVPAGLTGWAAVNGLRGDTSISDRVRFDNAYIQNWSLWLDLKILLRTIGAVLGRTGG